MEERPAPLHKYVVKEKIVVGNTLPDDVLPEEVPDNNAYAYTVINDRHVIVSATITLSHISRSKRR